MGRDAIGCLQALGHARAVVGRVACASDAWIVLTLCALLVEWCRALVEQHTSCFS